MRCLRRQKYATDTAIAFALIEIVWAPVDGARAVLVCVFENERHAISTGGATAKWTTPAWFNGFDSRSYPSSEGACRGAGTTPGLAKASSRVSMSFVR